MNIDAYRARHYGRLLEEVAWLVELVELVEHDGMPLRFAMFLLGLAELEVST